MMSAFSFTGKTYKLPKTLLDLQAKLAPDALIEGKPVLKRCFERIQSLTPDPKDVKVVREVLSRLPLPSGNVLIDWGQTPEKSISLAIKSLCKSLISKGYNPLLNRVGNINRMDAVGVMLKIDHPIWRGVEWAGELSRVWAIASECHMTISVFSSPAARFASLAGKPSFLICNREEKHLEEWPQMSVAVAGDPRNVGKQAWRYKDLINDLSPKVIESLESYYAGEN